jgi:hypothetical protein
VAGVWFWGCGSDYAAVKVWSKADVDKYGRLAYEKKITEAVSVLK